MLWLYTGHRMLLRGTDHWYMGKEVRFQSWKARFSLKNLEKVIENMHGYGDFTFKKVYNLKNNRLKFLYGFMDMANYAILK